MSVMNTSPRARSASRLLFRLLVYYVLIAVVLGALVQVFPGFAEMLSLDFRDFQPTSAAAAFGADAVQPPRAVSSVLSPMVNTALVGALAMLGGLIFSLPVAWTYTGTKQEEGFDKSVVQMIVMLPLAVGGVTLLVRGEIALAFALAGIVAAVRFRTTFKDVKDAVFAFVAIGVGLASGMQAWLLAAVFSLVFCVVVVGLWRFEVGEVRVEVVLPSGPMALSEALTPGDGEKPILVGDPVVMAPLKDEELEKAEEQASRLEHFVRADALRDKQKYKHLLLVYSADAEEAEDRVEDLLEHYAKRWQLVEVLTGRNDIQILEYLVRFKKTADVGELLDRLHRDDDDVIRAIELKSMKGTRQLVT
jgi:hypothetical protein